MLDSVQYSYSLTFRLIFRCDFLYDVAFSLSKLPRQTNSGRPEHSSDVYFQLLEIGGGLQFIHSVLTLQPAGVCNCSLSVSFYHPSLILVWHPWLCSQLVQIVSLISSLPCQVCNWPVFLAHILLWCPPRLCPWSTPLCHVHHSSQHPHFLLFP